ncbi:MAG: undecaprenyl-diphosphatase UppP [Chloroherpetonaceae bacterium]|nr:undecaprenyl-diphosphatase UppP [Chloroherpetonaceae bacterium]MDW8438751.1 undecaprenyl-diphosphatase UppP [Chloroherpetonaceae bacterium]
MSVLEAIALGIVQGLTEFLPISSTAHLRIVPALLGWRDPGAAFTAVIQIGTLVAVLYYFHSDLARIAIATVRNTLRGKPFESFDSRMGYMMAIGTMPIVVMGLALKSHIETSFRSLYVIAAALIGLAIVLMLAEFLVGARLAKGEKMKELEDLSWREAVVVGLAQCLALVPGASRSGVTIAGGLFLGMTRETAARFSFLLSLPSIFAAGMFQLFKARSELFATSQNALALLVATVAAGVVGYYSIAFLLNYLKKNSTYLFIAYRVALGLLLLTLVFNGALDPMK